MKISYTFNALDLFSENLSGYNVPASAANYASAVRSALATEFPDAEIDVNYQLNITGYAPEVQVEDGDRDAVQEVISRVYDAGEWVIEK